MALFFANLAIILETFKSYAGGLHDKSFPWFSFSVFGEVGFVDFVGGGDLRFLFCRPPVFTRFPVVVSMAKII